MTLKYFFYKNCPFIIGILGWCYYLIFVFTFFPYINYLALSGLTVTLPSLLLILRKRNRNNWRPILRRRLIITGFSLGLILFILFPNLIRIPSQIYRRVDRCNSLITPYDPHVIAFRDDFITDQGGLAAFNSLPLQQQLDNLDHYVHQEIIWTEDLRTKLMAGDLSTPAEAIIAGKDDCRGQAVVTVSVLLNLGYDAWVVEMPWHFWTMVYDSGNEYPVNQYGSKNSTIQYPILLIWNNQGYKYIRDPLGTYLATMGSSPNFYDYIITLGPVVFLVGVLLGFGAACYSTVSMGDFRKCLKKNKKALSRFKMRLFISIFASLGLMGLLSILFFTPFVNFGGLYLFVFGFMVIFTLLNIEEINDKLDKLEIMKSK